MPDTIGYVAAAVSCLAFGSFAVPIKAPATRGIAVDPLGKSAGWAPKERLAFSFSKVHLSHALSR